LTDILHALPTSTVTEVWNIVIPLMLYRYHEFVILISGIAQHYRDQQWRVCHSISISHCTLYISTASSLLTY